MNSTWECMHIIFTNFRYLKSDRSADHGADTGTARPATVDLTLDVHIAIRGSEGHATSTAVTLVIGVK